MGLPALLADYLFVGPLIVRRLQDTIADTPAELCETVEQVLASDQRTQVLMVMWAGDRFAESEKGRAGTASQLVSQRWAVMLCLNNVSQAKNARQAKAGPTLSAVHKALSGWVPEGAVNHLVRVSAPLRPDINARKAIYPMGFELSLSL